MKTALVCIVICAFSTLPAAAQASELEARYSEYLAGRAALLDSMMVLVAPLSADELLFDTPIDRKQRDKWADRMTKDIERAKEDANDYFREPSLYHAAGFETSWLRLWRSYQETWQILGGLRDYGMACLGESWTPEQSRELAERSAINREVYDAVQPRLSAVHTDFVEVCETHCSAYDEYIRSASEELQRIDWQP